MAASVKPKRKPRGKGEPDPVLQQKLEVVRQFIEIWLTFFEKVRTAHKDAEQVFSGADEEEFLKLKSNCARRHQFLLDCVGKDYIGGERITPILRSTVTLVNIQKDFHEAFYRKVEKQWHTALIHLYETVGHLRYMIDNP